MTGKDDLKQLTDLQDKLGYHFQDVSLLERAVTHSSLSSQTNNVRDLERLEFLGDRVLGLLTAENLWQRYPDFTEGEMAPRLNALVRKETCAQAARTVGLQNALRLSAAEEQAGGRNKDAILGDACEALLGAMYIDGGLKAARHLYALYWGADFDRLASRYKDSKTALQEWAQGNGKGTPAYEVVERTGPAHAPLFKVEVVVEGVKPAVAQGASKRAAQTEAAQKFLIREKIWSEDDAR